MSGAHIYQDLKYKDSNVYNELQNLPPKQQQPYRNAPTLQDKPEAGIQKSAQDGQNLKEVKDLEKKLRLWRIITVTVSLLIIVLIILAVSIYFTQCNKQGAGSTGLQKLKEDICVNNAASCTYCRNNWIYYSGNCYLFSTDSLNWTASRDNCRRMDSQLAIIKNRAEETFIELTSQGPTWIGLSKTETGLWIWDDGTALGESFWNPNEPNNNVGAEGCVEVFNLFYNASGWNDAQCQGLSRSLCKRPAGMFSA